MINSDQEVTTWTMWRIGRGDNSVIHIEAFGKLSYGRRFPVHGGLYGQIRYLDFHGMEKGAQRFFKAGLRIKKVLETDAQYMLDAEFQILIFLWTGVQNFLDAGFRIEIFLEIGIQYFADAGFQIWTVTETGIHKILHNGSQNVMKMETCLQKVLHAGSETVINLETGIRMINRPLFLLCSIFQNRRPNGNPTPVSTLIYIWKPASR